VFIDEVQLARPAEASATPDERRNWRREKRTEEDIELWRLECGMRSAA
jgi:hypothetical protein